MDLVESKGSAGDSVCALFTGFSQANARRGACAKPGVMEHHGFEFQAGCRAAIRSSLASASAMPE
jgi:hypothetical protein